MKKVFITIWNFLNGKKTYIGLALHGAWLGANIAFPHMATTEQAVIGHTIIGGLTGTGTIHKVYKGIKK